MKDLQLGVPENSYDWSWTIVVGLFVVAAALILFIIYYKRGYILHGLKEVYHRTFKSVTPTYFKRIFWAAIAIAATPEVIHGITELLDQPEYMPSWVHADWLKAIRWACIGAAAVAKQARKDGAANKPVTPEPNESH